MSPLDRLLTPGNTARAQAALVGRIAGRLGPEFHLHWLAALPNRVTVSCVQPDRDRTLDAVVAALLDAEFPDLPRSERGQAVVVAVTVLRLGRLVEAASAEALARCGFNPREVRRFGPMAERVRQILAGHAEARCALPEDAVEPGSLVDASALRRLAGDLGEAAAAFLLVGGGVAAIAWAGAFGEWLLARAT